MNLRGQSSVEFLTITVFLLGALLLFQIFASAPLEEQITLNKASIAAKKLAQKIDEAYSLGPGTKFFVEIDLPDNIESEFIGLNEFGWTLSTGSGTSDVYELTDAQIIGAIPSVGGIHLIPVEVLFSGIVLVGEGADDFDFPIIFLQAPDDNSTDFDGTVIFDFNVNDFNSSISSCSLIIDGSIDQTDNSITEETAQSFSKIFGSSGTHVWDVNCTDSSINFNESSFINGPRIINISLAVDNDFPVIYLEAPDNNGTDNDGTVQFDFNVSDITSGIASCELIIDGNVDQSDFSITEGVTQSFSKVFAFSGTHSWDVNCSDSSVNANESSSVNGPRIINIELIAADTDFPVIFLEAPADNYLDLDGNLLLDFNVFDAGSGIDSCSLLLDNAVNQTDNLITESVTQSFSLNGLTPKSEYWSSVGGVSFNDIARAFVEHDLNLLIGGSFTNAAGIAEADRIVSWNGSFWTAL